MTRKHYIELARMLNELHIQVDSKGDNTANPHDVLDFVMFGIARICAADNTRFDSTRFYIASKKYLVSK